MTEVTPELLDELLPLATAWAEAEESRILAEGVPLTKEQRADASWLGVMRPDRVRLLAVANIPAPEHPVLRATGQAMQLISPYTAGLTLRHGIYLRKDFADDRYLIAHELVHTAQYERLGGVAPFLRRYLHECLSVGYPNAPLEEEAVLKADALREKRKSQ
jgi:hypothetical protein